MLIEPLGEVLHIVPVVGFRYVRGQGVTDGIFHVFPGLFFFFPVVHFQEFLADHRRNVFRTLLDLFDVSRGQALFVDKDIVHRQFILVFEALPGESLFFLCHGFGETLELFIFLPDVIGVGYYWNYNTLKLCHKADSAIRCESVIRNKESEIMVPAAIVPSGSKDIFNDEMASINPDKTGISKWIKRRPGGRIKLTNPIRDEGGPGSGNFGYEGIKGHQDGSLKLKFITLKSITANMGVMQFLLIITGRMKNNGRHERYIGRRLLLEKKGFHSY